jgi:hypothetical protein
MFLDDETKSSISPEVVPESATPFYSGGKRALNIGIQRMRQWGRIKVLLAAVLAFAAGFCCGLLVRAFGGTIQPFRPCPPLVLQREGQMES